MDNSRREFFAQCLGGAALPALAQEASSPSQPALATLAERSEKPLKLSQLQATVSLHPFDVKVGTVHDNKLQPFPVLGLALEFTPQDHVAGYAKARVETLAFAAGQTMAAGNIRFRLHAVTQPEATYPTVVVQERFQDQWFTLPATVKNVSYTEPCFAHTVVFSGYLPCHLNFDIATLPQTRGFGFCTPFTNQNLFRLYLTPYEVLCVCRPDPEAPLPKCCEQSNGNWPEYRHTPLSPHYTATLKTTREFYQGILPTCHFYVGESR